MLPNENAYLKIERDENSPMYKVFELQCLLKLFRMALHSREALVPFTESDFFTLETCAAFLADEAGEVGASFEGILRRWSLWRRIHGNLHRQNNWCLYAARRLGEGVQANRVSR